MRSGAGAMRGPSRSSDDSAPYARPNLSNDYLAGTGPDEWMPLRSPDYYSNQLIGLELNARALCIDVGKKQVYTASGKTYAFDRLLLAMGADPVKLPIPNASESNSFYLRSYADGRALLREPHRQSQGVVFHLDNAVTRLEGRMAVLKSGARVEADFLVLGVGARPSVALAE